jgi:hypothetical protein
MLYSSLWQHVAPEFDHLQAIDIKFIKAFNKVILDGMRWQAWCKVVEALRNDCRWCHWNRMTLSFRPHCGPGVDSASNRNEYWKYFLGSKVGRSVGLTNATMCRLSRNPGVPIKPIKIIVGVLLMV